MNRLIYEDSRRALCDKIGTNIQSTGSIIRQIVKGSRTSDILSASARNFVSLEQNMNTTDGNLQRIYITQKQFHQQMDNIISILEENRGKVLTRY